MNEPNFLSLFGHLPMTELLADWKAAQLTATEDRWAGFPPTDFLEFVRAYPRVEFDAIPPAAHHLKPPSFLIGQAHRIWLTTSAVHKQLMQSEATSLLDLGSFPFFNALVLREFFGFTGSITVTTNLALSTASQAFLAARNIKIAHLDLDPFVSDPDSILERIPATLDAADGSFDVILSSHVIEHLYHPPKMLAECHRLLSEGGRIIISTDNGMMIDAFTNFVGGIGYIYEPVQHTAAMHFDFWRGHVRFFTGEELKIMLAKAGFAVSEPQFFHCFYDVLFEDYFKDATPSLPGWKRKMLSEVSWLRNDVLVVGEKKAALTA